MTPHARDRWLPLVRLFLDSSLSFSDFAQRHSLNVNTFRNYYYRLRSQLEDPSPAPTPQPDFEFLPLVLAETEVTTSSSPSLRLRLSANSSLDFADLPPPDYLARFVAALERSR